MSSDTSTTADAATADESVSPADPPDWTGDTHWATRQRPVGATVLLLALVAFWSLAGGFGVLAWLAIAGCWLLFPPIVPVALGQFLLVAVTSADAPLVTLLPAETALLGLLAASFLDSDGWRSVGPPDLVATRQNLADAFGYVGMALVVISLTIYVWQAAGPLLAGGFCVGLVGVVGYSLRPALVEESDSIMRR